MAAILNTSSVQPHRVLPSNILAIDGARGTSAILCPKGVVSRPYSSNASNENNNSRARIIDSAGGGERNSNRRTLSIPRLFSARMTGARSVRWISGTDVGVKDEYADFV